jgi:rhodanese-related sulfurtransferase
VTVQEITPKEAADRLAEFVAVDVREGHEFRGPLGRIPGARHVPLGEIERRAGELPKGRPLLLVCRSGGRSGKACEQLAGLGVMPVVNLAGGMIAWNRAQLEVEHEDPASLADLLEQALAWLVQMSPRTASSARDLVARQLEPLGASFDRPTHAAVERVLDFIEESVSEVKPPDLDLSMAAFRRSLAVL